ncbi:MAG: 3-phosphoshikimate 1-carboxyvinyltransferase [Clostridia bacterium]|nr:3-phosphoshikimate 1-carboxyvinyltransferase [Clostridia bacterium]
MTVTITSHKLSGPITPPPSKSQAHRALIAAALAGSEGQVENLAESRDILATRRCMAALGRGGGAAVAPAPDALSARRSEKALPHLDCGESGSTLRFLIPVALALRGGGVFTGQGRLMERPQEPYFEIFREKGVAYEQKDGVLTVLGALTPGSYALRGDVSSQFVTGLLYALPLLDGDSDVVLTTPLESRGYVDMTVDVLTRFGVEVECRENGYHIPGGQVYRPSPIRIESDYSQAGFYYAANGLGNTVNILGLNPDSRQGDRVIAEFAERLSMPGEVELDVADCPDLVPPLAAWAALREGQITRIVNAGRLRIKESDRLDTVAGELNKLGADVEQGRDFLTIQGVSALRGGVTDSHNDHRIAMMVAIAATRAEGAVTLTGAESVQKSYPNFWEDYRSLGGRFV